MMESVSWAAVDRLVHHATIFEMNVESYRRKAAQKAKGSHRATKTDTISDKKQPD